jgi:hypothetical protein
MAKIDDDLEKARRARDEVSNPRKKNHEKKY